MEENRTDERIMRTEKELGEALKQDRDEIIIEGDLANKTIRIKATGKVAWGVCLGFISLALVLGCVTLGSGGTAAPVTGPATAASAVVAAPAAIVTLGIPATVSAIGIAMAGGGVGALKKLRKYRMEKIRIHASFCTKNKAPYIKNEVRQILLPYLNFFISEELYNGRNRKSQAHGRFAGRRVQECQDGDRQHHHHDAVGKGRAVQA